MKALDKANNKCTSNENENTLQLRFSEIVGIKTVADCEKAIRIWNNILNSFASITQQSVPEINIAEPFKALEQQIIISISENLLHCIVEAFTSLLELKTNQNKLQNTINQIEQIVGECEYFTEFVNEKHEQLKAQYIMEVTDWLMLNYYCGTPEDFDGYYEKLQIAVEQLFSYIQKNGEIGFSFSNLNLSVAPEDNEQLRCA